MAKGSKNAKKQKQNELSNDIKKLFNKELQNLVHPKYLIPYLQKKSKEGSIIQDTTSIKRFFKGKNTIDIANETGIINGDVNGFNEFCYEQRIKNLKKIMPKYYHESLDAITPEEKTKLMSLSDKEFKKQIKITVISKKCFEEIKENYQFSNEKDLKSIQSAIEKRVKKALESNGNLRAGNVLRKIGNSKEIKDVIKGAKKTQKAENLEKIKEKIAEAYKDAFSKRLEEKYNIKFADLNETEKNNIAQIAKSYATKVSKSEEKDLLKTLKEKVLENIKQSFDKRIKDIDLVTKSASKIAKRHNANLLIDKAIEKLIPDQSNLSKEEKEVLAGIKKTLMTNPPIGKLDKKGKAVYSPKLKDSKNHDEISTDLTKKLSKDPRIQSLTIKSHSDLAIKEMKPIDVFRATATADTTEIEEKIKTLVSGIKLPETIQASGITIDIKSFKAQLDKKLQEKSKVFCSNVAESLVEEIDAKYKEAGITLSEEDKKSISKIKDSVAQKLENNPKIKESELTKEIETFYQKKAAEQEFHKALEEAKKESLTKDNTDLKEDKTFYEQLDKKQQDEFNKKISALQKKHEGKTGKEFTEAVSKDEEVGKIIANYVKIAEEKKIAAEAKKDKTPSVPTKDKTSTTLLSRIDTKKTSTISTEPTSPKDPTALDKVEIAKLAMTAYIKSTTRVKEFNYDKFKESLEAENKDQLAKVETWVSDFSEISTMSDAGKTEEEIVQELTKAISSQKSANPTTIEHLDTISQEFIEKEKSAVEAKPVKGLLSRVASKEPDKTKEAEIKTEDAEKSTEEKKLKMEKNLKIFESITQKGTVADWKEFVKKKEGMKTETEERTI